MTVHVWAPEPTWARALLSLRVAAASPCLSEHEATAQELGTCRTSLVLPKLSVLRISMGLPT